MLYDLEVWAVGLVLFSPAVVLRLAWARRCRFYGGKTIPGRRKAFYFTALVAASVSTLAYFGYWGWRVCGLNHIALPFTALLAIERFMYVGRLLSAVAIVCLFVGRGPHRALVVLATLWVMLQLWIHGGIIHWA